MPTQREQRQAFLAPLFAYVLRKGIKEAWLARRLDIETARFYRVRRGDTPIPEGFVERACAALEIAPETLGYADGATLAKAS